MTNPKYSSRELPTIKEIQTALCKADTIYKDEFQRLRVKAVISLVYKFGKRRSEITRLKMSDLKTEKDFLHITFTLFKALQLNIKCKITLFRKKGACFTFYFLYRIY